MGIESGIKQRSKLEIFTIVLFLTVFYVNIFFTSEILNLLFYISSALCCVVYIVGHGVNFYFREILFMWILFFTSMYNRFLIGNISLNKFIYLFFSFFIAKLLLSEALDEKICIVLLAINAIVVMLHFFSNGFNATDSVFLHESNNYVSIYLLYPTALYYVKNEMNNKRILIFPAVLYVICCLLAQGRMGIVGGLFFALSICLIAKFQNDADNYKTLLSLLAIFIIIALIWIFAGDTILDTFSNSFVFRRFVEKGTFSGGRTDCWIEYINLAFHNFKYLLFGTKFSDIVWLETLHGNLHNSFLFIHAYNGIIMFLFVIIISLKDIIWAFSEKRMLYLVCFATVLIRSMTDYFFWGTTGTPFFLIFMLIICEYYNKYMQL